MLLRVLVGILGQKPGGQYCTELYVLTWLAVELQNYSGLKNYEGNSGFMLEEAKAEQGTQVHYFKVQ